MDSNLVTALSTLIAGFGGAALSAWYTSSLSFRAAKSLHMLETEERQKEQMQTTERQRASVRALVNLELDHNIEALRIFWHQVNAEVVGTPLEKDFVTRRRLVDIPMPAWEHRRWQSLSIELIDTFNPDELRSLQKTHAVLDDFTRRRASIADSISKRLCALYDAYRDNYPVTEYALDGSTLEPDLRSVMKDTFTAWSECEAIFRQLDAIEPLSKAVQ